MKSKSISTISPARNGWKALSCIATLLVGACSSEGGGDISSVFDIARNVVDPPNIAVSLQQAASIPHATMGIRLGGGSEILTVLAIYEPGQLWVAGTQLSIVTRRARIVQTVGLEHDLTKLIPDGDQPLLPLAVANGQAVHTKWLLYIADLGIFSAPMECDARPVRPEAVSILGKSIETERVEETCNTPSIGWTFTNVYWISQTSGLIWMSVQNIHPKMDAITTEFLRPPATQD